MLLKPLIASLSGEVEPTVMAEGAEAGLMVHASAPQLFPAAMTGTMPAAATAAGSVGGAGADTQKICHRSENTQVQTTNGTEHVCLPTHNMHDLLLLGTVITGTQKFTAQRDIPSMASFIA
jgi:hypothetical protein